MKVVVLAGGFGTRLSEKTDIMPKPMVEIGGRPILWHIMKIYSAAGFDEFIICLGYKGYVIKKYFATYSLHMSDVTFDLRRNDMQVHQNGTEPWRVTLVDTGEKSDGAWINGGFFAMEPEALNYIKDDSTVWEREPMETLAREGKLAAYRHSGYWQNMDTLRDKNVLEDLWQNGNPPWKIW
jgi:glucose-1-phosphate cytidylyltransferase